MKSSTLGRPRDEEIDLFVLETVRKHLAIHGLNGLSISSIAAESQTTRASIYRRWPNKLSLALAAISDLAEKDPPIPTDDPLNDLESELAHFRKCINDASSQALVGVMLQDGVDPEFKKQYRKLLVEPRRARILACLERGILLKKIPATADVALIASFATGSWYSISVAGNPHPKDWAKRTATAMWNACGARPL